MSLQDQVNYDQKAVDAAQAALIAAQEQLAKDTELLNASQPHLSALAALEAFIAEKFPHAQEEMTAIAEKIRGMF